MSDYDESHLPDLLPLYYKRVFPSILFYRWLCYGEPLRFGKREISFTLFGDIYLRYQSFETLDDFQLALAKRFPIKIDIGAVYKERLQTREALGASKCVEKELVFDIDLTDYDDVRTCCQGAAVCNKCWMFMVVACLILDVGVREDFGYEHILWVFSGRRGIHAWVCDTDARTLDDLGRDTIAQYFHLVKKDFKLPNPFFPELHPSIQRAVQIIDKYFVTNFVVSQDLFGTDAQVNMLLDIVEPSIRSHFEKIREQGGSEARWNAFLEVFKDLDSKNEIPQTQRFLVQHVKIFYCYPRLDLNVSRTRNHLLKAPFCVHPKTGKICIPFEAKNVEKMDPDAVPNISQLVNEINEYDAKTASIEQTFNEDGSAGNVTTRLTDYKKTSLLKAISVFKSFLRQLETSQNTVKTEGDDLDF